MSDNFYQGEALSFIELLEKNRVEIPIVQRDYAQGRLENTSIRLAFLEALKESIVSGNDINLDFVYGNITEDAFQPLDGQQRITTLFLLHWYAAVRCGAMSEMTKKRLTSFSYETRISSREFCEDLVNSPVEITSKKEKLSDKLINSNWFFLSWNQDPTIRAMLTTIDDIHACFYDIKDLWENLVENKRISFHYLILKDFGLSDDLYIKMNARGRLLTSFENFKAGLQKIIQDNGWEQNVLFPDTFASKVDTKWTDFFWTHFRDANNSIDAPQMRFIYTIVMNAVASDKINVKDNDKLTLLQDLNYYGNDLRLLNYLTEDVFRYLYDCYECYTSQDFDNINLSIDFVMWRHKLNESILAEVVKSNSSYTHKALFYAQTEFLLRNKEFNRDAFCEWMRVIRNIVSRGNIDSYGARSDLVRSPYAFSAVINLINELAKGCSDIYGFLSNANLNSSFAKDQVIEEQRKAIIIKKRPEIKELIWKTEDNELLRGRISFIFDCIGYNYNPDDIDMKLLSKVQIVFHKYFNNEYELTDKFRRAMLTIEIDGKYESYHYWTSGWAVAPHTIKRKLFIQFRELEYYIYSSEQHQYFKQLVLKLTEKSYDDIINEFVPPSDMPNWKIRLIKEEGLLKNKCKSNYFAVSVDASYCYLLKSQRPRELDGNLKVE